MLHGTRDGMIPASPHVEDLVRGLGGGEEIRSVVWEGKGHILLIEKTDEVAELITEMVQKNI